VVLHAALAALSEDDVDMPLFLAEVSARAVMFLRRHKILVRKLATFG